MTINLANGGAIINPQSATVTFGVGISIVQSSGNSNISGNRIRRSGHYEWHDREIKGTITAALAGNQLLIDPLAFTNTGTLVASVMAGTCLSNRSRGSPTRQAPPLTGGQLIEANASSTIALNNNLTITTDDATIILSGTSSNIESENTNTKKEVLIDTTLTSIGTTGTLELLAGRSWTDAQDNIHERRYDRPGRRHR